MRIVKKNENLRIQFVIFFINIRINKFLCISKVTNSRKLLVITYLMLTKVIFIAIT